MKKIEILNSLNSISHSNSYSKYGNLVEKMHKHLSLKSLINKLKNPVKIAKSSFLERFNQKFPFESTTRGIQDEDFSEFNFFKNRIENKNKELIIENKNKNNNNNKIIIKKKLNLFKVKPTIEYINLDPFKYSPNYNSIYKKVPSVKFYSPSKEFLEAKIKKNKIKINKNILKSNESEEQKNNNLLINKKNNDIIDNNKDENIKKSLNEKIMEILNNNKKQEIITPINSDRGSNIKKIKILPYIALNKNKININNSKSDGNLKIKFEKKQKEINHSLRFSHYTKRKWVIKKYNDILSYISPFKYNSPKKKIKTIDFKKMKPHAIKNLLNLNIINNPSICYYEPKYDSISTKNSIIFTPNNKKNKKYLLHKILSSYDVHKEYLTVDNDKLNKIDINNIFELKYKKSK